jgi:protein-S-isoprenylcysteine O-methyltransferase Ste14
MNIPVPVWIVWGSWTLFIIVWAAMAGRNKQTAQRQDRAGMRRYLWPLLIGTLVMALPHRPTGPLSVLVVRALPYAPAVRWVGAGAALLGVATAIWARRALGRNWSGDIQLKQDHELVTSGPYALVRHPIYTALILLYAALACQIGTSSALAGLALVILSCWIKLRQEEALMLRTFPDAYPAYMARTRRLVPGLV